MLCFSVLPEIIGQDCVVWDLQRATYTQFCSTHSIANIKGIKVCCNLHYWPVNILPFSCHFSSSQGGTLTKLTLARPPTAAPRVTRAAWGMNPEIMLWDPDNNMRARLPFALRQARQQSNAAGQTRWREVLCRCLVPLQPPVYRRPHGWRSLPMFNMSGKFRQIWCSRTSLFWLSQVLC